MRATSYIFSMYQYLVVPYINHANQATGIEVFPYTNQPANHAHGVPYISPLNYFPWFHMGLWLPQPFNDDRTFEKENLFS